MNPIVLELQYLPPVNYFIELARHKVIWVEQHENYSKGSYRNRCHIAGANGVMRLSIPLLKGKHQQQSIRQVQMAYYEPWPMQHWQSICSAYGRAPFFEEYAPALQPLFKQPGTLLFDFNMHVLQTILQLLELQVKIYLTSSFVDTYDLNEAEDFRNVFSPKVTPPEILYYPQVFEDRHGFLPHLSILDLLFCTGPEANAYLHSHMN